MRDTYVLIASKGLSGQRWGHERLPDNVWVVGGFLALGRLSLQLYILSRVSLGNALIQHDSN